MYIDNLYYKFHIDGYENFKQELIESINNSWSIGIHSDQDNITRSDWGNEDKVFRKEWSQIFFHYTYDQISDIYKSIGYNKFNVNSIWFQEYGAGSNHGWHTHGGANFSNVFFLNFSKENPPTEFLFHNEIIKADVSEGDLIIFPGHIIHRSPSNDSEKSRLVVVFNSTIEYC